MEAEGGRQVGWRGAIRVLTCIFPSWKVSVQSRAVEFLPTVHYHRPHPPLNAHTQTSTSEPESISLLI